MKSEDLAVGMLIDSEGQWLDRHKFFAEKIIVDLRESDKKIRGTAYLQEKPEDADKIATGQVGQLKLDGYLLEVNGNTKREWNVAKATTGSLGASSQPRIAACHVKYTAVRRKDGKVDAEQIELGPPAAADRSSFDFLSSKTLRLMRRLYPTEPCSLTRAF